MTFSDGNLGLCLRQTQRCDSVKLVNGIPFYLDNWQQK